MDRTPIRNPARFRGAPATQIFIRAKPPCMTMAKTPKRRRRSMGKYLRGNIELDMDLGTLGPRTAIAENAGDLVTESMLVSSIEAIYSLTGLTIGDNRGPILFGVAHNDYATSEIEEFIEDVTGWDIGDLVAQEKANRKIRRIGIFPFNAPLNDGKPIKTKLNWLLATGDTVKFWAYNLGTLALQTTDPNINIQGKANLWLR